MGGHVKRNFNATSTRTPNGNMMGKIPWPVRPSGSTSKSTNANPSHGMGRMDRQAVVPDFVSKPAFLSSKYGYQEVHALYDEMRTFFAKRATSTYQNEVATIKVTLMSMKPNNRNPQMVAVRTKIT